MTPWIILNIIFFKVATQFISLPLNYVYYPDQVMTNLLLGTPPKSYRFSLSTTIVFSEIFLNKNYNQTSSLTLMISTKEALQTNFNKGNISSDVMTFDHLPLNSFQFILIDEETIEFPDQSNQGVISLSRSPASLLSHLYRSMRINQPVLQLHQKTLTLGFFNKTNNRTSSKCNLIDYENQWGCKFKGISFESDDKYFNPIRQVVIFKVNQKNIIFPHDYWSLFKLKYFADYLREGQCDVYKGFLGWSIECDEVIATKLGSIYFYLENDVELELKFKDLFDEDMLDMDRQVFRIDFRKNATTIQFGWKVFEQYSIALNDDGNYAEFFFPIKSNDINLTTNNEEGRIIVNHTLNYHEYIVIGSCIVVLLCGSFFLYFIRHSKLSHR